MKKKEEKKINFKKFKLVFAEKVEMFALVAFIFSLFLLDVNANMIGSYGQEIEVNLLFGKTILATSLFWAGFLFLAFCQFLLSTRTIYHPKRKRKKSDIAFSVIGVIGLMIILSGGMLLFWYGNDIEIPFFNIILTRISYYHIGIGLEALTVFYFALFK